MLRHAHVACAMDWPREIHRDRMVWLFRNQWHGIMQIPNFIVCVHSGATKRDHVGTSKSNVCHRLIFKVHHKWRRVYTPATLGDPRSEQEQAVSSKSGDHIGKIISQPSEKRDA